MKYLVIYEKSAEGWGAYAPDLPGFGVAGETLEEVKELIRKPSNFIWTACASKAIRFLRPQL